MSFPETHLGGALVFKNALQDPPKTPIPSPSLSLSFSLSKMDKTFSLLVAFSLLLCYASGEPDGDTLIRQVVDGDGEVRLGAEHHFSLFKRRFGKAYASQEEHDYRFEVFKANLRRARRHQRLDPSASHGVTRFSDRTPAEFRRTFLGLRSRLRLPEDANKAPILPIENLPEDFDWRERGAVTEVKNQVLRIFLFIFGLIFVSPRIYPYYIYAHIYILCIFVVMFIYVCLMMVLILDWD